MFNSYSTLWPDQFHPKDHMIGQFECGQYYVTGLNAKQRMVSGLPRWYHHDGSTSTITLPLVELLWYQSGKLGPMI